MHGILKTLLGWYCCFDLIKVRKPRIREVKWLMHGASSYSGMELGFKQGQADPECPGSQGLHAFMSHPLSLIGEDFLVSLWPPNHLLFPISPLFSS